MLNKTLSWNQTCGPWTRFLRKMGMWREKRLRHKTHLNRNPLDYLGYPNAFKEEVTEHWRKRNEWEREHGLEFLSKDAKLRAHKTKLRAHKTNPSSVLRIFTLHPVCLSILLLLLPHHTEAMWKRVRRTGWSWSSTFWPWTCQLFFFFSSVTLEISFSERFIFLMFKWNS